METLQTLPLTAKHISREALARCIEAEYWTNYRAQKADLANLVRQDKSFDVVIVSEPFFNIMQVKFVKFKGYIPLYDTYCGHSLQKAVEKLPYGVRVRVSF